MTPLGFTLTALAFSLAAGVLGAIVGVGGGIIVVPGLTLLLGVDIRLAIAASIVCVIATSSGAAASFVKDGVANLRLAMLLELGTVAGAIVGAASAKHVPRQALFLLFGAMLVYVAWSMARPRRAAAAAVPDDPLADRLRLHGDYFDVRENRLIAYRVARVKLGLLVSAIAGVTSGLLGIGGGAIKVPVMNLKMGVPLKVCTATSNLMIGVTAASSAIVYLMRGEVRPFIVAPVAIGVLIGATLGARLAGRLPTAAIRAIFLVVLLITAGQMLWKGARPS